jgi:hypothetical protein
MPPDATASGVFYLHPNERLDTNVDRIDQNDATRISVRTLKCAKRD